VGRKGAVQIEFGEFSIIGAGDWVAEIVGVEVVSVSLVGIGVCRSKTGWKGVRVIVPASDVENEG
jgi:hypothetical protein